MKRPVCSCWVCLSLKQARNATNSPRNVAHQPTTTQFITNSQPTNGDGILDGGGLRKHDATGPSQLTSPLTASISLTTPHNFPSPKTQRRTHTPLFGSRVCRPSSPSRLFRECSPALGENATVKWEGKACDRTSPGKSVNATAGSIKLDLIHKSQPYEPQRLCASGHASALLQRKKRTKHHHWARLAN